MNKYANVDEKVRSYDDGDVPHHTIISEMCGGEMPPRHDSRCQSNVSLRSGPTPISLYCEARLNDQGYQGRKQFGAKFKSPVDLIPPVPTSVL